MPHGTQAEIFIETLTELLAEERARRAARALRVARAQADRFLSRSFDDVEGQRLSDQRAGLLSVGMDGTA